MGQRRTSSSSFTFQVSTVRSASAGIAAQIPLEISSYLILCDRILWAGKRFSWCVIRYSLVSPRPYISQINEMASRGLSSIDSKDSGVALDSTYDPSERLNRRMKG